MNDVFRLDGVSKRFGDQVALDNVSLAAGQGVVFALLGENGAGKTTAIRILLGLLDPDRGGSQVLGLNSRRDSLKIRQRIGYVPERPTLYEWMTVSEVGWFTAGFYGDGFLPRYLQLAQRFDLPPSRKLKALSKGMRAKVILSLAMAHDPQLLVLDEPTSGLDAVVRREFLESIVDLAAQGRTVLLSSHQINEVERVADIVAIVHQGKLVLVERLDELKQRTRELIITLEDVATALPTLAFDVVSQRRFDRQWQMTARGISDEAIEALRRTSGVADVEVRTPNLEEIFVAYVTGGQGDDSAGAAVEPAAPPEEASTP